jgi:hypothetical protein
MSRRFVRIVAALTLAAALAVPAVQAAGPFHAAAPRPALLDLAWSWLAGLWPDTAGADKGFTIDPDGSTVQGAEPRTTPNEGDKGFTIDPEG